MGSYSAKQLDQFIDKMGFSSKNITECVENSFVERGNYNSENMFLKEDLLWMRIMEVNTHPAITINNHTYTGDMDGLDIAKAICASFKTRPQYCDREKLIK